MMSPSESPPRNVALSSFPKKSDGVNVPPKRWSTSPEIGPRLRDRPSIPMFGVISPPPLPPPNTRLLALPTFWRKTWPLFAPANPFWT
jgi:hypothetical protein